MDGDKVNAALSTVKELSSLDEDLRSYLSGLIADASAAKDEETLRESIGPFLESSGACSDDAAIAQTCSKIFAALVAAKLVKGAKEKKGSSSGGGATKELKKALVGGGTKGALKSIAEAGEMKAALKATGLDVDVDDEDEDDGGDEGAGAVTKRKVLAAPVKLGAKAAMDNSNLDFLWGKETNAFLNQNTELVHDESIEQRAAKKAAREAKKEESKAKYEKAKAAAEAAATAAADAEDGRVTSGTVTYSLTEERQKGLDVHVTGFTVGYGGEPLLDSADLHIVAGRRYGLVGRNGMGKSSLLHAMARGTIEGAGKEKFPKNLRVLHVTQEVAGNEMPVLQTVLNADVERKMLLDEETRLVAFVTAAKEGGPATMASSSSSSSSATTVTGTAATEDDEDESLSAPSAGAGSTAKGAALSTASAETGKGTGAGADLTLDAATKRLAQIAERLEAIDASSAEARAGLILSGLGFTKEMTAWPTKSLSGGWRMRVALAAALFMEPEILCLDEPTNHIDARSLMWLVEYLLTYPKTLVIVSHDRWFLNQVCTDIIHLNNKKLDYYKGDYDTYEKTRAEKMRCLAKQTEAADLRRKHVQSFIDKFRYNAKRASLVQSRIKALERMEVLEEVADDPKWKFEFPDPGPLNGPMLQVDDVTFGYTPDRLLLKKINFSVDMQSRIALVGPNGIGKSTLLKLLLGELEPQEGSVIRNSKLRIAYFTQHHVNMLDMSLTPVEMLTKSFPGAKPDAVRAHLGSFGLSGDLALQTIKTLSGGQKSRVSFALITWKKPHLMILDEVSNNLDIETIDAVIIALGNFNGGVVLVSHDEHLVDSVCDEIFVVGNPAGTVKRFKSQFKDYRKVAVQEVAVQGSGKGGKGAAGGAGGGGDSSDDD